MTKLLFASFALISAGLAAPVVEKVDPPNWWLKHTRNPIQLLLTGKELKGAAVKAPAGFKVTVRQTSDDGRYLFAYVDIPSNARPGQHRFAVTGAGGTAEFSLALDPPIDPRAGFQGFTPDDVIYLLMPDRFANGDPENDSPPEYERPANRSVPGANHGGDFRGIRNSLGYLKELGLTGIWLNPIYKNSYRGGGSAHGYSTVDFYAIEPRFGSMSEFRELVQAAHRMGIKVMQDQIANHSGPRHPWVEAPPTPTWFHDLKLIPRIRNNFDIAGLADPYSRPKRRAIPLNGWFASILPDFDQDDPLVSDYLIQNALWWVGMTGLDGIRQDTYPYVDRPFWEKWQTALVRQFPKLFVVGEITARTPEVLSFFDGGIRRHGVDTGLTSMLDFPLERTIRSVFGQGEPLSLLAELLAHDSLYRRPELLVTFFGNHDQPRFLTVAGRQAPRLLMAQTFLLTTRGIPHLYYGDEIAMSDASEKPDRSVRADFPGGFPGDEVNAFTAAGRTGDAATVFNALQSLLHFRRDHVALRRGSLVNLLVEKDRYAYLRSSPEEYVLVVLNRAGEKDALDLEVDDLGIPEGLGFQSWPAGREITVQGQKLQIRNPREIEIYQARRIDRGKT